MSRLDVGGSCPPPWHAGLLGLAVLQRRDAALVSLGDAGEGADILSVGANRRDKVFDLSIVTLQRFVVILPTHYRQSR